jgi:hypothetical protein
VFFVALLLSAQAALPEEHVLRRGISTTAVAVVLVFSVLSVLVVAVAIAIDEVQVAATYPVLQHAGSKRPVVFEHYRDPSRFHLFLSHAWASGQDQVLSIKKELLLIVPTLKIWLDVENLADIAGLEDNITNIDMTLLFMSKGYFKSWNCLREVRHATLVHCSTGPRAIESAAVSAIAQHRSDIGIQGGGSSLILVRETSDDLHGGIALAQLLGSSDGEEQCPEKIGCGNNHVLKFDPDCAQCLECPINIRAELQAHAGGQGGVIDWIRFKDFKMVSLRQIVQQMLVASQPGGEMPGLCIPGELSTIPLAMPKQPPCARVLLLSRCHLSDELPSLLKQAVPEIEIELMEDDAGSDAVPRLLADAAFNTADGSRTVRLLAVVHDGCFQDDCVVRSLTFALENKVPIALLHEADAGNRGCTFGTIIGQCPSELMQIRGHGGAKLFDAIAVQFSRGPHQPVSMRLLAMSLGAEAAQRQWPKSPMPCLRRLQHASMQICQPKHRSSQDSGIQLDTIATDDGEVGWHHGIESTAGEAGTGATANPLHTEQGGVHRGAVLTREHSDRDKRL